MNWTGDSDAFGKWLGTRPPATILPQQYAVASSILDTMGDGDLISIMYNAPDARACLALAELKHRFNGEMYQQDQINDSRMDEDSTDMG